MFLKIVPETVVHPEDSRAPPLFAEPGCANGFAKISQFPNFIEPKFSEHIWAQRNPASSLLVPLSLHRFGRLDGSAPQAARFGAPLYDGRGKRLAVIGQSESL